MAEKPQSLIPSSPSVSDPASVRSSDSIALSVGGAGGERAAEYVAEMRAARGAGVRWRRISRWIGLAIFVVGASLLIYVFWQALEGLSRYSSPGRLNSDFNTVLDESAPSVQRVIQATSAVLGTEILRVFYLLILGFIASALAARGIQFFAASEAVIDEAVVPEE